MAAHQYWRIKSITTPGSGLWLSELHLFDTSFNQVTNGSSTITSSHTPDAGALSQLLNGSLGENVRWSEATAESAGFWIKFDFGGSPQDIAGFKQGVGPTTANNRISGFTWEWSDDDSAWTAAGSGTTHGPTTTSTLGPLELLSGGIGIGVPTIPVGFLVTASRLPQLSKSVNATGTPAMYRGYFVEGDIEATATVDLTRLIAHAIQVTAAGAASYVTTIGLNFARTVGGAVTVARDYSLIRAVTATAAVQALKGRFMTFAVNATAALTAATRLGILAAVTVASTVQAVLVRVGFIAGPEEDKARVAPKPSRAIMPAKPTVFAVTPRRSTLQRVTMAAVSTTAAVAERAARAIMPYVPTRIAVSLRKIGRTVMPKRDSTVLLKQSDRE